MNVTLEADIDLKNIEWIPIGTLEVDIIGPSSVVIEETNGFHGNFDGKNHIISNLTYSGGKGTEAFGFFGLITGEYVNPSENDWSCDSIVPVTVKNIIFANVNIIGDSKTGVLASALQAVNVSNVEVAGTITAGDMGGICAAAYDCNFDSCKTSVAFRITDRTHIIDNGNPLNYSFAGGIAGQFANNYDVDPINDYHILGCDTTQCTYTVIKQIENYQYYKAQYIAQNFYAEDGCYNLYIDVDHNEVLEGEELVSVPKHPNSIN